MRCRVGLLVVGVVLLGAGAARAAEAPVAVSPGTSTGSRIGDPCPTFSWGEVDGAKSYELVVYRLGEEGEEAKRVLRQDLPGSADGWTPSLDQCLERGGEYAWSVRAWGEKAASEWSAPSLFEVAAGPSEAELAAAIDILRQYLAQVGVENPTERPDVAPNEARGDGSPPARLEVPDPPGRLTPPTGDSDLTVNGAAVVTTATIAAAVTALQRECPGALGVLSDRYADCGNGAVRDNNTGLYWLKDASCSELAGTNAAGQAVWETAEAAAASLAEGTCGLTDGSQPGDWRQPTAKEFCSAWAAAPLTCPGSAAPDSLLLNPTPSPMINKPNPFVDVLASHYWSSNRPIVGDTAWVADLDSAHLFLFDRSVIFNVWPVRFGPVAGP